jgi:hypothetical protein
MSQHLWFLKVLLYTGYRYIPYTVAHHNSSKNTLLSQESRFYVLTYYSTQFHGTMLQVYLCCALHVLQFHVVTYVRANFFT